MTLATLNINSGIREPYFTWLHCEMRHDVRGLWVRMSTSARNGGFSSFHQMHNCMAPLLTSWLLGLLLLLMLPPNFCTLTSQTWTTSALVLGISLQIPQHCRTHQVTSYNWHVLIVHGTGFQKDIFIQVYNVLWTCLPLYSILSFSSITAPCVPFISLDVCTHDLCISVKSRIYTWKKTHDICLSSET